MNVLIVDDDIMQQQICQSMLQLLDHSSVGVQNTVDAVRRLTAVPPQFDLVVLEYDQSELSGMEFFNILREWQISIPVILTARLPPHPEFEVLLEGFSRIQFLPRPFTLEALKLAIERIQV